MFNQRGFSVLAVVFLSILVLIPVVVFLLKPDSNSGYSQPAPKPDYAVKTPEPSPVRKLKTYEGKLFIFSYLADWEVKEVNSAVEIIKTEIIPSSDGSPPQKLKGTLAITSEDISKGTTLENWFEQDPNRKKHPFEFENISRKFRRHTQIDGLDAISYTHGGGDDGYIDAVTVFVKGQKGYEIALGGREIEDSLEIYNIVRDSFKLH